MKKIILANFVGLFATTAIAQVSDADHSNDSAKLYADDSPIDTASNKIGYTVTMNANSCGVTTYYREWELTVPYNTNFTTRLDGQVAGVQSTNGGGQPGNDAAVLLRGYSAQYGNNTSLFVVDGFPYFGDLSSIDPADIESVTFLKNAVSSIAYSQYGNANGVVEIVTKKGNARQGLTIDARVGLSTPALRGYKTMAPKEYYETASDGLRNDFQYGMGYSATDAANFAAQSLVTYLGYNAYNVPDNQLIDPRTGKLNSDATLKHHDNWQKELYRPGLHHSYNLAYGNSNNKSDYRFGAGYVNEQGYIQTTGLERFNARLNASHKFTGWLTGGINAAGTIATQNLVDEETYIISPIFNTTTVAPIYPVYYRNANGEKEIDPETGKYRYDEVTQKNFGGTYNALAFLDRRQMQYKTNNLYLQPYLSARFLKHFSFKSSFLFNRFLQATETVFKDKSMNYSSYSEQRKTSNVISFMEQLNWDKQMGKHSLDVGISFQSLYYSRDRKDSSYSLSGVIPGAFAYRFNQSHIKTYSGNINVNYNFGDKYFAAATFALLKAGTSVQAPMDRYEPKAIYGMGLGWVLTEERFFKNLRALSSLRLRASYGAQYGGDIFTFPEYIDNTLMSLNSGSKNKHLEAGIDFAFFRYVVSGSFDYYRRSNISEFTLVRRYRPLEPTIIEPYGPGTVNSNGLELNLSFDILRKQRFNWSIGLNAATNRSYWAAPPERAGDTLLAGGFLVAKGVNVNTWWLPQSAGVDPSNGDELWRTTDGQTTNEFGAAAYVADRGSFQPSVFGGLQNYLEVGRFDFSVNISYSLGGKLYDGVYANLINAEGGMTYLAELSQSWTPTNTNTDIPRMSFMTSQTRGPGTRYLRSASFLNIRSAVLGYTFKRKGSEVKPPKALKSMRVYLSANNLWLFAAQRGMNPQDNFNGVSRYAYSPARTIIFGLSVGL